MLVSTDGWVNGAVGFALKRGNFSCYPMIGIEFTQSPIIVESYLSQLMIFYEDSTFDIGSWNQYFMGSPISRYYFRDYIAVKILRSAFCIGPQIEGTLFGSDHDTLLENRIEHEKSVLAGIRITCDIGPRQLISFICQNVDRQDESLFRLSFRTFF